MGTFYSRHINLLLNGTIPVKHILEGEGTGCAIFCLLRILNNVLHCNWKNKQS